VIGGFSLYVLFAKNDTSKTTATSAASTRAATAQSTSTTTTTYRDGNYTGSVADAFYGNIQVNVTVNNGKIADIRFLQYPSDHHESMQINTAAMPILTQEAITAQTAHIDGVTGATDTSQAFIESMQSALNQAKA